MEFIRINKRLFVVLGLILAFVICDSIAQAYGHQAHRVVSVNSGPHAGRVGMIVSHPWIGSLYNQRPTVNVAATEPEIRDRFGDYGGQIDRLIDDMREGHGPRQWIKVSLSNTSPASIDNPYVLQDGWQDN